VQKFTYRGADELYSNTYHFTGGDPGNTGNWDNLQAAVVDALKVALLNTTTIVRAIGHNAGDVVAVYDNDLTVPGPTPTGALTVEGSAVVTPGDTAIWLRWLTANRTSRGKPIYLRKYFHDCRQYGRDEASPLQKSALETYGAAWVTGFYDGSEVHSICGPLGATGHDPASSTWITTRTLERRGRRLHP
jgi:hypothetical protein